MASVGRVRRRIPYVLVRGVLLVAVLVGLGWAAGRLPHPVLPDAQWVDLEVAGRGWRGHLAFLLVGATATALGFPRQVIAFLAGYAFGAVVGTEAALAASIAGCAATFAFARAFAARLLTGRLRERMQRLDAFLDSAPFQMTLVVRLLPVGSNLLTNLLAGITRVRPTPFLAGSAVGYLPQTVAFALAGAGAHVAPVLHGTLGAVLLVASALIGVRAYRATLRGSPLEADVDRAIAGRMPGT